MTFNIRINGLYNTLVGRIKYSSTANTCTGEHLGVVLSALNPLFIT